MASNFRAKALSTEEILYGAGLCMGRAGRPADEAAWWRDAVIYQVYIRSFADGNGDGIGDIAGHARPAAVSGASSASTRSGSTPGTRRRWPTRGYDVADYRDIEPLFGTLAEAEALIARGARARVCGCCSTSCPTTPPTSTPGSGRRWPPGPGSPSASATSSGPAAGPTARCRPTTGRASSAARPGRGSSSPTVAGRVVPAPVRPRAAGPQLGAPGRARRVRDDPARSGSTGAWTGSASTSRTRWSSTRELPDLRRAAPDGRAEAAPAATATHPHWDRDEVHEIYRAWRAVADSLRRPPGVRRRGVGATSPERLAATCGRDELHTAFNFDFLRPPWDARRPAARHRRDPRRARRGRRAGDLGAVQPRRRPARVRGTAAQPTERPAAARRPDRPSPRTSTWARGGPARRPC